MFVLLLTYSSCVKLRQKFRFVWNVLNLTQILQLYMYMISILGNSVRLCVDKKVSRCVGSLFVRSTNKESPSILSPDIYLAR